MKVELFPLQERTMSDFIERPYENEKTYIGLIEVYPQQLCTRLPALKG